MTKGPKNIIPLLISNVIIILLCVFIYMGFKNSDAPFAQILGAFNVILLFPIFQLIAGLVFLMTKKKRAAKIHFITTGVSVLIIVLLIGYSYL